MQTEDIAVGDWLTIYPTTGTYKYYYDGFVQGSVKSIQFVFSGYMTSKHIEITLANNTVHAFQSGTAHSQELTFSVGISGRTVRLVNLPTSTNTQDEVYKEGDGSGDYFLKIKH